MAVCCSFDLLFKRCEKPACTLLSSSRPLTNITCWHDKNVAGPIRWWENITWSKLWRLSSNRLHTYDAFYVISIYKSGLIGQLYYPKLIFVYISDDVRGEEPPIIIRVKFIRRWNGKWLWRLVLYRRVKNILAMKGPF